MKRVLIFSHEYPPFTGGVGSVGYQLTKQFLNWGYDVHVLCGAHVGLQQIAGAHYIKAPLFGKSWLWQYPKFIAKKLNLDIYDTIILNESLPCCVAGYCFSIDNLNKCLAYVHGLEVELLYQNRFSNILRRLMKLHVYHSRALRNSYKVIFVSKFSRKKFISVTGITELETNSTVVYNGICLDDFMTKQRNESTNDLPVLLSVGRMVKGKGLKEMYHIFKRLYDNGIYYYWIIVGDGHLNKWIKKKAEKDRLISCISIIGRVDREQLHVYFGKSDLFWLLSNYDENFGLVYIEAQAAGIPVIGRKKGGVTEVILNGNSGFLVSTENECYSILKEMSWKNIKRENILKWVERFELEITGKKIRGIIEGM